MTHRQSHIKETSKPGFTPLLWLMLAAFFISGPGFANELIIAANPVDGQQRQAFQAQIDAFENKHPNIKVKLRAFEHESFKTTVEHRIGSPQSIGDVLFWFGGASLRHFADQNWIRDISYLWDKEKWHGTFSNAAKQAVTRQGAQFGMPLYYYQWGIYYRKSIFKKWGLSPPQTWDDLISISQTLKAEGIVPFTLGSKNHWTAAGWFDYVNLRLNGLEFHLDLLNGCVDFEDPRVSEIFKHLQLLRDLSFFLKDAPLLDWKNALPYLYHGKSAMLLMGNFFLATVPKSIRDDIDFFPFPEINKHIPPYEDAPTDVLIIPKYAKNIESAEFFLEFMATKEAQSIFAKAMNMIPTNQSAVLADDMQIRQGAKLLGKAKGLAQFFDRDAHPDFTKQAMPLISNFITIKSDVKTLQRELEKARRHIWPSPNHEGCLASN